MWDFEPAEFSVAAIFEDVGVTSYRCRAVIQDRRVLDVRAVSR